MEVQNQHHENHYNQMPTQQPMPSQPQKPNELNKNLAAICVTVILVSIIISGAILFKGSKSSGTNTANNNVPNQQQNNNQPAGPTKVSVDNDAVLGSANAPLTMIEFSDYECPFCKRHFDQVYPEIKRDYIDTGKLKLVYRDFIAVPSHNPLATAEAMAAECAREQGGDSMYYKYHDEIFKRTTSNGSGLTGSQLAVIAKDLGINSAKLDQCVSSNKYKDEVSKDIADAQKAGVNGTPSFFVGKSTSNGIIDGTIIIGAQPYSAFKVAIDAALAK